MTPLENIIQFLHANGVSFRTVHHEPTTTSEASAKARGEELSVGGKAIVMKIDGAYKLFVLSAALRVDSQKIKSYFGARKFRFATVEELLAVTGLVPGSVPPFGKPILDLDLYVDTSVPKNALIAFNAGSLTDSIIMETKEYLRIAQPTVFDFSQVL